MWVIISHIIQITINAEKNCILCEILNDTIFLLGNLVYNK